ncbi:MAG: cation diffusion facilitator family transporter [Calditrichia bacterium]
MSDQNHQRFSEGRRSIVIGVSINAFLAVIKILAGVVGHSYALIADGIESALDIFSSIVVWNGLKLAAQPPDERHPYGHGKAEALAAIVVAFVLIGAAIGIAIQSVREILTPHLTPAPFTLIVLIGVIITKEFLFRFVYNVGESIDSTALKVDAWHQRSDALTSLAAFIGISFALLAGPGYESADDWCALVACGVIGYNGYLLFKTSISDIMDETAPPEVAQRAREISQNVQGVYDIETCRMRKSGFGYFVDIHVEVDGAMSVRDGHSVAHKVADALKQSELNIHEVLVHIEPNDNRSAN